MASWYDFKVRLDVIYKYRKTRYKKQKIYIVENY